MKKAGASNYIGSIGSMAIGKFCPVCYPAIGAFLASTGLGFVAGTAVLKGLLVMLLGLGLFGLWRSRRAHRKPWPMLSAIPSALFIYAGKYVWPDEMFFYAGVLGLITALALDIWSIRSVSACPACMGKEVKTTCQTKREG